MDCLIISQNEISQLIYIPLKDHKLDVGIGQCVGSKGNLNMFENSPFDNCNNCDCRKELYNTDPSSPTYIHCITRSCTIRQCDSSKQKFTVFRF